jgi:hypothetical protein
MDARRQQFLSLLAPAMAEAAATRRTDARRPKPSQDRRSGLTDRRHA